MKKQNTTTEPQLYVDSHHGIYSYQFAWQWLREEYKQQAKDRGLSAEDIESLESGPEDEHYHEAADNLSGIVFTEIETGQNYYIGTLGDEADIWFIPEGYTEDID
jgi:hypothetical protein